MSHRDDTTLYSKKENYLLKKANANMPPRNMPKSLPELIAWAGDLGGAATVYTFWTAAIAAEKAGKPESDPAMRAAVSAAFTVRRHKAETGGWPSPTGDNGEKRTPPAPTTEQVQLADALWSRWCAAAKPGIDDAAGQTAWALWYQASPPLRLQLINSAEQMRLRARDSI